MPAPLWDQPGRLPLGASPKVGEIPRRPRRRLEDGESLAGRRGEIKPPEPRRAGTGRQRARCHRPSLLGFEEGQRAAAGSRPCPCPSDHPSHLPQRTRRSRITGRKEKNGSQRRACLPRGVSVVASEARTSRRGHQWHAHDERDQNPLPLIFPPFPSFL